MSIEVKIQNLTDAIEKLTSVLMNDNPIATKEEMAEPAPEEDTECNSEFVRDLAKSKIEGGATRKQVKELITELGAESISKLNAKQLVKLKVKLEAL